MKNLVPGSHKLGGVRMGENGGNVHGLLPIRPEEVTFGIRQYIRRGGILSGREGRPRENCGSSE